MRRVTQIVFLLSVMSLITGCDFIRKSLGKPTSDDIEKIRIERRELEQGRLDSIAKAEAIRDSLHRVEELNRPKHFYLLIGSFKVEANAISLKNKIQGLGYDAKILDLYNGMKSVSVFENDDESIVRSKRDSLINDNAFKYDIIIYDNEIKRVIQ